MKFCFEERPEHFGALFGYCDHQVHKLMGKLLKRYDVSVSYTHLRAHET